MIKCANSVRANGALCHIMKPDRTPLEAAHGKQTSLAQALPVFLPAVSRVVPRVRRLDADARRFGGVVRALLLQQQMGRAPHVMTAANPLEACEGIRQFENDGPRGEGAGCLPALPERR